MPVDEATSSILEEKEQEKEQEEKPKEEQKEDCSPIPEPSPAKQAAPIRIKTCSSPACSLPPSSPITSSASIWWLLGKASCKAFEFVLEVSTAATLLALLCVIVMAALSVPNCCTCSGVAAGELLLADYTLVSKCSCNT